MTILAILLLPLSVWAMTPVTDADLSNVTGQAGVSINADLTMNINIGTMAWGDSDGVAKYWSTVQGKTAYLNGGFVRVNNFNISGLHIRARGESPLVDNYNGYSTFKLKPITIDVATSTGEAMGPAEPSQYVIPAGTTFVRFGLGALQVSLNALSLDVALGAYSAGAPTLNQVMGSMNLGAMNIYINPLSYVDIYAHAGQGVNFRMSVVIDRFEMGYASWGDSDGLNAQYSTIVVGTDQFTDADTTAGYVGLNGLTLGSATAPAITVTGTVAIDVLTTAKGIYAVLPVAVDQLNLELATGVTLPANAGTRLVALYSYYQQPANVIPTVSVVHISFPGDFSVTIGQLRSQVVVASNAALTTNPGVMGDIYLQQMALTVVSGSWVDIWAH